MRYLFDDWNEIKEDLREKRLFIFLDYDGTLTPIAETPAKAILSKETRRMLRRVSRSRDCSLAIVSGRALKQVRR
ncbi:MAG: trehalose-phosphatase, partial [Candidatus Omnitrophica bacterium]|nr:trehalose-phosphatase [Candidatus Omnitrophota bacterium]